MNLKTENSSLVCTRTEIGVEDRQTVHGEPGLPVPPSASTGTVSAKSRTMRGNFLDTLASPVDGGATREKPTGEYNTLSADRLEFKRMFLRGELPKCRLFAERMIESGVERVAWIHNLGLVATEQGQTREAYSLYLTNCVDLDDAPNYDRANYYLSFGMTSQALWQLHGVREYADRALFAYRQASSYYEAAGYPLSIAYAENNIGWLLVSLNEPEKAFSHLDRAETLFSQAGELARVADVNDTRALAYEKQGDYRQAFESATCAVGILKDMKDVETKSFEESKATLMRVLREL